MKNAAWYEKRGMVPPPKKTNNAQKYPPTRRPKLPPTPFPIGHPMRDQADGEPTHASGAGETVVDRIVQRVAELPDRSSPEDWPEAMLVTADELREIIADELS